MVDIINEANRMDSRRNCWLLLPIWMQERSPFLKEGDTGRRVDLGHFYRRRVLRIMPLYAVAVAVAVTLSYSNATAVMIWPDWQ